MRRWPAVGGRASFSHTVSEGGLFIREEKKGVIFDA